SSVFGILLTALSSPILLRAQDRIPPSAPRDLFAGVANCHQVDLSWTASADKVKGSGLRAYIIHRSDGVESVIVAARTSFTDANRVTSSTALTYTVAAVDFAGNQSAASNAVTVTTPPCAASGNEQGIGDFEGDLEVSV